jgi:hypothetical protein
MRALGWLAASLTFAATFAAPHPAKAETMDPALARLVTSGGAGCRVNAGSGVYYNPGSGYSPCSPDNAAFAKLIAQYGMAIAPTAMHSARTTGYGGFELSIEGDYTTIDKDASYWKLGTQGPQNPVSKNFSIRNDQPPGVLQLYNFKIRKGFPFGLELTGNFGYLAQSSIYTLGADVRWSLFEGFRRGIPAIFPELAVGGSVRTIAGTDQFQLTVVGVDGQLSKPIPIAGTTVLTPWIGYQFLRIFGDSGLIDMTPNTDAVSYCGYQGTNTRATPDPSKTAYDGQPVCSGKGSSADFNNTTVFNAVRLNRHRIIAGMQLRVQMIALGAQFMYDVVNPADANKPDKGANLFDGVGRQMTWALELGAVF